MFKLQHVVSLIFVATSIAAVAAPSLIAQHGVAPSLFRECCGHYSRLQTHNPQGLRPNIDSLRFPEQQFASSLSDYITHIEAYKPINFDSVYCPPPPANSSAQTKAEIELLQRYTKQLLNHSGQSVQDSIRFREIAKQGVFLFLPGSRDSNRIILAIPSLLYIVREVLNVDSVLYQPLTMADTALIRKGGAILEQYADTYPKTFRWLALLAREGLSYSFGWKKHYMRPRPYQVDTTLMTLERPPHASYPSNHSIFGFLMAKAWQTLLPPAQSNAIQQSANEYGFSREIAGIHYPSDTQASKTIVENLWLYLQNSPAFIKDMQSAQAEWRR